MKRIFSLKGLLELLKALAKFLLIGGVTALLVWQFLDDFLGLSELAVGQALVRTTQHEFPVLDAGGDLAGFLTKASIVIEMSQDRRRAGR